MLVVGCGVSATVGVVWGFVAVVSGRVVAVVEGAPFPCPRLGLCVAAVSYPPQRRAM